MKNKIVIITGLTGTGKSGLAVEVAEQHNGEIISADSVQIYKKLNIGSAKVTADEMHNIKHYLLDIKEYNETYNVNEFVQDCMAAIKIIVSKGKLPIICGGTGLYIKSLIEGYTFGESANLEFRQKYQKLAEEKGNDYVWQKLNEISPEKAKAVHPNNLKRVIRYLELASCNVEPQKAISPLKDFDVCCVGIIAEREKIYKKLNLRVEQMIEAGLEQEVVNLVKLGAKREMQAFNSIGYREWFDYFEGKTTKQQTIDLIKQHNRNYCKRQLTLLKIIPGIKLLKKEQAKEEIERFLDD